MKVRKAVKKIVALGVGATMLGATLLGATAADLGDFPGMFIDADGSFNGLFVVGASADSIDVVGINAITAAVQAKAVKRTWHSTGGGETISVEGGVDLNSGTDEIYLGEAIGEQTNTITASDLDVLAGDTFMDDDGTKYDYTHEIKMKYGSNDAATFEYSTDDDNDLDDPTFLLQGTDDEDASTGYWYNLRVEFEEEVDFTHVDSKSQEIKLFGKTYTVGSDTSTADGLQLLGGAEEVTLNVGESAEVESEDGTHIVEILGVSDSDTGALKINGETKEVEEGNTYNVGGVDIYVDTVAQFGDQNTGYMSVQLNSDELWLKEGEVVQVTNDKDDIEGTYVQTLDVDAADEIEIQVTSDDSDNDHLAVGESFVDPVFGTVELAFTSVNIPLESEDRVAIEFENEDDDESRISFVDENGESVDFVWAVGDTTQVLESEDSEDLHIYEGAPLAKDDWTVISSGDTHLLVQLDKIDVDSENDTSSAKLEFNVMNGVDFTVDLTASSYTTDADGNDIIEKSKSLMGEEFTFRSVSDESADDPYTYVTISDSNDATVTVFPWFEMVSGNDKPRLFFYENITVDTDAAWYDTENLSVNLLTPVGELTLGAMNVSNASDDKTLTQTDGLTVDVETDGTTMTIGIQEVGDVPAVLLREDENQANSDAHGIVVVKAEDGDTDFIQVDAPAFENEGTSYSENFDDSDYKGYVTQFGTYIVYDSSNDDYNTMQIHYPKSQVYAKVFVSPLGAEETAGSGAGYWQTEVVPIPSTSMLLDTEVTNPTAENMIIVGGPCANSVAATVMGADPTIPNCVEGFVEGKAKIALYDETDGMASGKVALLVAGYTAADTRRAATVMSNYDDYAADLVGKEVEVTGTSMTDITVGTPMVVEPEVEEPEAEEPEGEDM